jgi:hypothetical protein
MLYKAVTSVRYAMYPSVLPFQALEVHFLEASVCAVTFV